nr:glycerate kinase-like isoform X1 [Leptinotarsa decemlineata]
MFRNNFKLVTSPNVYRSCKSLLQHARKMTTEELKEIFMKSVKSVEPQQLIRNEVKLYGHNLVVRGQTYRLLKPCYVVGFGKAVLGMATEIEKVLGNQLERGIVSVPEGIFEKYQNVPRTKIQYVEGAKNNLPDENALRGAKMIQELVEGLTEADLLIVLVSGGGSALLPLPIPPILLDEKQRVIKELSKRGADIYELNSVRKRISIMKGGGLAELAYPCRVVSLVLSDIIGDPLDFIASGPTIPNSDSAESASSILKKYHLFEEIPHSMKIVVQKENRVSRPAGISISDGEFEHVKTFIIGWYFFGIAVNKLEFNDKGNINESRYL